MLTFSSLINSCLHIECHMPISWVLTLLWIKHELPVSATTTPSAL